MRRKRQRGLTLIELIVAFTILSLLSAMSVPLARYKVRRDHERDLLRALDEIRKGIDKFKDACDGGKLDKLSAGNQDTNCWPKNLDQLTEGVKAAGQVDQRVKFLRRIPKDPMTGLKEWGTRSDQDDPKSSASDGKNVFDVFTKSTEKAKDGTPYSDW